MKLCNYFSCIFLLFLCANAQAKVHIAALTPTLPSPQPIGAIIGWTATATDSNPGPLAFQFNLTSPNATAAMVKDFDPGKLKGSNWQNQPYSWALTGVDGTYQLEVVAKDFTSGESASLTVSYTVNSPLSGSTPVAQATQNPLVALFTAPSCAAGSSMRVSFQPQAAGVPATYTNWMPCQPPS